MYIRIHATKLDFIWWASRCADAIFDEAFRFQTLSRQPQKIRRITLFPDSWDTPYSLRLMDGLAAVEPMWWAIFHITYCCHVIIWNVEYFQRRPLHVPMMTFQEICSTLSPSFSFFFYRASDVLPTVMILRRYSIRIRRRPSQEEESELERLPLDRAYSLLHSFSPLTVCVCGCVCCSATGSQTFAAHDWISFHGRTV